MSAGIGIARGAGLSTQFALTQRLLVKPAPTTPLTNRLDLRGNDIKPARTNQLLKILLKIEHKL